MGATAFTWTLQGAGPITIDLVNCTTARLAAL